jgi:hypothetical protein
MNPAAPVNSQQAQHEYHQHQHKASRLRGGGAGRVSLDHHGPLDARF